MCLAGQFAWISGCVADQGHQLVAVAATLDDRAPTLRMHWSIIDTRHAVH